MQSTTGGGEPRACCAPVRKAMRAIGRSSARGGVAALAAFALAAGAPGAAFAQPVAAPASAAPPPQIALDPGMHTAPIRRIALDAAGSTLVTASDDKTARLWDVASGRALATLHMPGAGETQGRLYGAAIAGDGTLALAGTTAAAGGAHRIYLYDLATRAFLRALDARGGNVKRLEWSPDGRLLAAAYADTPALRVFDRDGRLVFEERYAGDAYYLAFASNARLAVSASDGRIHLYAIADGRVSADGTLATALRDPRGLQFSPDGRALAVGYLSRDPRAGARVDVFDVAARSLARSFAFADVAQGNLMNVAWSADGRTLFAAGTGYRGRNGFVLKRIGWPDGRTSELDVATNSVLDLARLPDGRLAFATAEPSWGIVAGDRVDRAVGASTAQFYEAGALAIANDARAVAWPFRVGEAPVRFALPGRRLDDGAGPARRAPVPSTSGLAVTDWENAFAPRVAGRALALEPTEVSRAAAVLPGDAGVIVATSRTLRRVDAGGREVWTRPLAAEARAVNASADGRLVVVAQLDGTIAWRRASDGAPLLWLFVTRERKWVLWTEDGYYDVAAGAEHLVGWRVTRAGGDQADFFPLSRFRERWFRPDVIDRVLDEADVARAVAAANLARAERTMLAAEPPRPSEPVPAAVPPDPPPLPPVQAALPPAVTLLTPATVEGAQAELAVDYAVLAQAGVPVTAVTVRVDGRPVDGVAVRMPERFDGKAAGRATIPLPRRDAEVQVFAANASGVSTPAVVSFRYRAPAVPVVAPPADTRPRLFVVAVGVTQYANRNYNLVYAAKDATDFAATLSRQRGRLYRDVEVKLLTDAAATRAGVLDALQWLKGATGPNDVGVLYLAGHGLNDAADAYYFLPHDADARALARTAVPEEALRDVLTAMKGKSLFFVDTCYSGKAIGVLTQPDLTRISNRFSSPEFGIIVFSASHGRQESRESPAWGNGAFTKALVEGLNGRADFRREGFVTHKGLDYYVSGEVRRLTEGLQTPVTAVPLGLGDFSLAAVTGAP